ncbi:uncharacterized protein EV420DRAFT_1649685 [Desarmillaria tabescens]|uniref:Glycopeptide n=1 Tax=Armillaria tabescens TaxID=1929756 RepID=A0AA39JGT5_ARMTA|nr:uncharacterized protein EV420DRAFT_1649685 [Desarmillaria tabescens]KAK0442521.1 hypothetical protein EV420DRAFT_1649685 [Desarmillaria tabescens]
MAQLTSSTFAMLSKALFFVSVFVAAVYAESHTVRMTNRCGSGTPMLTDQGGKILSTGSYTSNGALMGARAWLQTGACGGSGAGCTIVEITLRNPPSPGAGSSVDISIIQPGNMFTTAASFAYFNGCNGQGKSCNNAGCSSSDAFHTPTDYGAQVQCEANDVGLDVYFC